MSGTINAVASCGYVPHAMHRWRGGHEAGRYSPQEHTCWRSYTAIDPASHVSILPVKAYQLIEALLNIDVSIRGSAVASHVTEALGYSTQIFVRRIVACHNG